MLQSMGLQRVGHDWVTEQQQYISLSFTEKFRFTCCLTYLPSSFKKRKRKKESEVTQLCSTLCNPMDCSLPGSSIYGILQARVLEWVAISFSRGSS